MSVVYIIVLGFVFLYVSIQLMRNRIKASSAAIVGIFAFALVFLIHVDPSQITKATFGPVAYERVLDSKLKEANEILNNIKFLEGRVSALADSSIQTMAVVQTQSDSIAAISSEIKEIARITAEFAIGELSSENLEVTDEGIVFYADRLSRLFALLPIDTSGYLDELIDGLNEGNDTTLRRILQDRLKVMGHIR